MLRPDPNDPNPYDSTSVTYGIGQLTGRTDPSGSYTFYYDASGNLTKEDKTIGGILYTTQYTYNNNNFLTSITYPSGRVITYTPDRTGRISQVSTTLNGNPKTLASAITYLPYGGVTGLTYGNGINLTQGYDNQYRISSIVTGSILDLTFGYDSNGNVVSILDSVNPPGGEIFDPPGIYNYQAGTNKLAHIEGIPSIDFGYDANANITTENTRTYVYDLSNQLIRVLDNSNQVAEYTYNGAGQRIKKVTQTETRIFHYDPWGHLIAETNQAGQMLAEYIYLGDELLAMIKPGESVYYFHNDHLGTPQVLTDDTGTIAWKAAYTPFGEAVASIQTVDNPFRFPGQYYDSETGLHYNYFRYYNPQTGRYITPDPIGLEGGINLFVYLGDNPINAVDPLGLFDYCVQRRIGNKTTIKCSSSPTVYNLKEPAPFDPLDPYEEGQLLEPNVYILLPRTTWGKVLPTGSPVYTTPGQEAGTIITPTGKKRGVPVPAGPHIGKRSEGCPLFPDTKKGRKQKEEFYRHFKENIKTGGTWIVILDDSKGGLTNEY